jgi:hypothetical protein
LLGSFLDVADKTLICNGVEVDGFMKPLNKISSNDMLCFIWLYVMPVLLLDILVKQGVKASFGKGEIHCNKV